MSKTVYQNLSEINDLQTCIMQFVQDWVRDKRLPVPQKDIIIAMKTDKNTPGFTTANALNSLMSKGYIRRAVTFSNRTLYVQIRRI